MSSIRIHVLHCGEIGVPPSLTHSGGDRFAALASATLLTEGRRLWLPVSAYLIEHPKGLVLVDTGWGREISPRGVPDVEAMRRQLNPALLRICRGFVAEGMTVREQLREMGLSPREIDCIVLTHLDADHISGLRELAGAKRVIVPEMEMFWASRTNFRYEKKLLGEKYPETVWYRVGVRVGPCLNQTHDLFGDGSVLLVHLEGHTFGMCGVLVYSGSRYVLLQSDCAFSAANLRDGTVPGMAENAVAQGKALDWLREVRADRNCVASIASHDPEVKPGIIEL